MLAEAIFWGAGLTLGWVYAGYPALVAVVGTVRPVRLRPTGPLPTVTVAIAAHDEAGQIEARVADALAQAGPGLDLLEVVVGSDGSTDATGAIVRRLAAQDPRVRLLELPRGGQTATQHALFEAARGDVIVLTDAETRFAPRCLAALAEALRDSRVGCATGQLEWRDVEATATASNEGLYWRYERAVRDAESRAGLLTAVTGALLAVRRSAYRPVPRAASMDHLLPLYVREAGGLVAYVPSARATDRPISGLREQFRNRTRTATRGILANASMARSLAPWRRPGVALAIWSHKLLRWATPLLLVTWAAAGTVAGAGGRPWYWLAPASLTLGAVMAAAAHGLSRAGRHLPRPLAFARAVAVVNLAFAAAWWNVLRGRRIETWHRDEWSARRVPATDARDPAPTRLGG